MGRITSYNVCYTKLLRDLCRKHDILVQAPTGQACVYHEMGRCPAPCDGSMTLEEPSYSGLHALSSDRLAVELDSGITVLGRRKR